MKKTAFSLILILGTGLLAWGTVQGGADSTEQSRWMKQELEIMQGILKSSLNFAADEYARKEEAKETKRAFRNPWRNSNISAFYLKGQGVVFIIPISGALFRYDTAAYFDAEEYVSQYATAARLATETARRQLDLQRELMGSQARKLAERAAEFERGLERETQKQEAKPKPPKAPAPPALPEPPAPPPPPVPPEPDREEIQRRLEEAQEKLKQSRYELEASRSSLKELVTQAKEYIVEALARHGDSLTFLDANEHINVIFKLSEGAEFLRETQAADTGQEVITIRKSIISEYKAGRLTLDGLKQKMLIYKN